MTKQPKTIEVLRIEDSSGLGPYNSKKKHKYIYDSDVMMSMTIPKDDAKLVNEFKMKNKKFKMILREQSPGRMLRLGDDLSYFLFGSYQNDILNPNIFGFISKTQLNKYFTKKVLEKLQKDGYSICVYEVPEHLCYIGDTQVVFSKRKSKLIRKI